MTLIIMTANKDITQYPILPLADEYWDRYPNTNIILILLFVGFSYPEQLIGQRGLLWLSTHQWRKQSLQ